MIYSTCIYYINSDLSDNEFSGTIPQELGNLSKLLEL